MNTMKVIRILIIWFLFIFLLTSCWNKTTDQVLHNTTDQVLHNTTSTGSKIIIMGDESIIDNNNNNNNNNWSKVEVIENNQATIREKEKQWFRANISWDRTAEINSSWVFLYVEEYESKYVKIPGYFIIWDATGLRKNNLSFSLPKDIITWEYDIESINPFDTGTRVTVRVDVWENVNFFSRKIKWKLVIESIPKNFNENVKWSFNFSVNNSKWENINVSGDFDFTIFAKNLYQEPASCVNVKNYNALKDIILEKSTQIKKREGGVDEILYSTNKIDFSFILYSEENQYIWIREKNTNLEYLISNNWGKIDLSVDLYIKSLEELEPQKKKAIEHFCDLDI